MAALLASLAGCAQPWRQYTGPQRAAAEVAVIEHSDTIDYTAFRPVTPIEDFGRPGLGWWKTWEFELLPGTYVISTALDKSEVEERHGEGMPLPAKVLLFAAWVIIFQGHDIRGPAGADRICDQNTITLDALSGHRYMIDGDFVDSTCWLWVEDIETGEIVAGSKLNGSPSG